MSTYTNDGETKANGLPEEAQATLQMVINDWNNADARKQSAISNAMAAAEATNDTLRGVRTAETNYANDHEKNESNKANVEKARARHKRAMAFAEDAQAKSKAMHGERPLPPDSVFNRLGKHPARHFAMAHDEFDGPIIKLPKNTTAIDYLKGTVRPNRPKLFKDIQTEQRRPQALEEIRAFALNHVGKVIDLKDSESIANGFFSRIFTDHLDMRGSQNIPTISDGKLMRLLRQSILDSFDRELCARADRLGVRQVTREERTANLEKLNRELVANDRLDCALVRAIRKENPDAPVYFREDADPFHVLNIIVDSEAVQPKPAKARFDTHDTVPNNASLVN